MLVVILWGDVHSSGLDGYYSLWMIMMDKRQEQDMMNK